MVMIAIIRYYLNNANVISNPYITSQFVSCVLLQWLCRHFAPHICSILSPVTKQKLCAHCRTTGLPGRSFCILYIWCLSCLRTISYVIRRNTKRSMDIVISGSISYRDREHFVPKSPKSMEIQNDNVFITAQPPSKPPPHSTSQHTNGIKTLSLYVDAIISLTPAIWCQRRTPNRVRAPNEIYCAIENADELTHTRPVSSLFSRRHRTS